MQLILLESIENSLENRSTKGGVFFCFLVRKAAEPRIYGPAKASLTMQIFPRQHRGDKEIMMRLGWRAYSWVFMGLWDRMRSLEQIKMFFPCFADASSINTHQSPPASSADPLDPFSQPRQTPRTCLICNQRRKLVTSPSLLRRPSVSLVL